MTDASREADPPGYVADLATLREREAATREILQIISKSRDDDAPVFEVILRNAARLCDAPMAWLMLTNEAQTELTLAAYHGLGRRVLNIGDSWQIHPGWGLSKAILEARAVQDEDLAQSPSYLEGNPSTRQLVDEEGLRTRLAIPLVSNGKSIGCIALSRRELAPFSPDDIALLETFAEQAVIAIDNVRQFREVQTRLERETALRDILEVISRSREDEAPVFDAILTNARRLCDAQFAALVLAREGDAHQRMVAHQGALDSTIGIYASGGVPMDPARSFAARAIVDRRVVHLPDMKDTDEYRAGVPNVVSLCDKQGIRTNLLVPLIARSGGIGALILFRHDVRPYSDDQIALVRAFSEQAVIAIENVRQFREVRDRLERETALRDILEIISRSRDDDLPVFRAILDRAERLCNAQTSGLQLLNEAGSHEVVVATSGRDGGSFPIGMEVPMTANTPVTQAIREGRIVHVEDARNSEAYKAGEEYVVRMVDGDGVLTRLVVPLKRGDRTFGTISLGRLEQRAFTADEIALVETFAAQAMIAIENVRQFKALETLNAELSARVDAQVGEIERMGRLRRFLPTAVADTVVSQGADKMLSSHRALLGVLFCDIRGFTAFCETAEPEETIEVLQTYHEEMGKLISAHGAGVDHRMGDGIMVLFNDPLPCDDPAGEAVRLALAMQAQMRELCQKWKRLGHRLGFGVGVSLGYATVGMVGYEGRYDYTASGTAVNLAARLCDRANDGEILLSARARLAVEDRYRTVSDGDVSLKGIHAPVEVFRLIVPTGSD